MLDGKLYGLPKTSTPGNALLSWNETAFTAAGVAPPTPEWDFEKDFLVAADKLTKRTGDHVERFGSILMTTYLGLVPLLPRWGKQIAAKGVYWDAVCSSHACFVTCSGLRWVCLTLLAPVRWAKRVWVLPCLTVLAPSERYHPGSSAPAPRRRNPTPVVGGGDPAHHTGIARAVLVGDTAGPPPDDSRSLAGTPSGLVPQARPDLRHRAGAGGRRPLELQATLCMFQREADIVKVPCALIQRLTDALCYAA